MGLAVQALCDKSQKWWHLSSIQLAGGIISLPVISVGSDILFANGIVNAILSIFVGNLTVLAISYLIIKMSYKERLNAVENTKQFIGKIGAQVFAFFILITTIGWVAWELFAGVRFLQVFPFFSNFSVGSLIGAIASLILLIGIRGLKNLCLITIVPLILLLLAIIFIVAPSTEYAEFPLGDHFFKLSGLSLVISTSLAAVIDYPTFFRHSKSKKDSVIAIVVIFIVTTVLQIVGVFIFKMLRMNKETVSHLIAANDIYSMIIVAFLLISMIVSVCWNIYAASVGWESLFPIFKDKTEYAVIGLVATALFSYSQLEHMLVSAAVLGDAVISGIGGVLIYEFLRRKNPLFNHHSKRKEFIYNNISWFFGSLFGIATYYNLIFPRADSTIISLLSSFVITTIIVEFKNVFNKLYRI